MKRTVFAAFFLLSLAALPLFAVRSTTVDDVIRMHNAGLGDEVIIAFVAAPHEPYDVTPVDIEAMQKAGVSRAVIDAVLAAAKPAAASTAGEPRAASEPPAAPPDLSAPGPLDPYGLTADDIGCVDFDPPIVLLYPPVDWLPAWLWDPYWYMPRYDSRVAQRDKRDRSGQAAATGTSRQAPEPSKPTKAAPRHEQRPTWVSSVARGLSSSQPH